MNLSDIITKCYILALIIRDDGERLLLGDGFYEFKESLQHFQPNTYQNDVIELQGTDGQLLAGQVRRSATQAFDGYIADGTIGRIDTEQSRRRFLGFFRKKHHYKVVYIMPDGTAVQRDRGYIVDAPSVPELYQRFPEYHIGLNFEDPNYYEYDEGEGGEEIPAHSVVLSIANLLEGGLIWDNLGAVSQEKTWLDWENGTTTDGFYTYSNGLAGAPLEFTQLDGNATQETLSGKNLLLVAPETHTSGGIDWTVTEDTITLSGTASSSSSNGVFFTPTTPLEAGTYRLTIPETLPYRASIQAQDADSTNHGFVPIQAGRTTATGISTWTTTRLRLSLAGWTAGDEINFSFPNRVMFSAGDADEPYEPYVGGVPSPNPDYPQDINVVSGAQTVKITGKNIFNINATIADNHTTSSVSGQSVTITTDNTSSPARATMPFDYLPNKAMTVSFDATCLIYEPTATNNPIVALRTVGQSDTLTIANLDKTVGKTTHYSAIVTPDNDTRALWLYVRPSAVAGDVSYRFDNIQIEYGTSESNFEPYQSQSQIINLGGTNLYNVFDTEGGTVQNITVDADGWATCSIDNTSGTGDKYGLLFTNNLQALKTSTTYAIVMEVKTKTGTGKIDPTQGSSANSQMTANVHYDFANISAGQTYIFTQTTKADFSGTSQGLRTAVIFASGQSGSITFRLSVLEDTTMTAGRFHYLPYTTYAYELVKIGTYQDYIWNDEGTWKIHKEIGKQTISSSTNIILATAYTNIEYGQVAKPTDAVFYNNNNPSVGATLASFATYGLVPGAGYDNAQNIGRYVIQASPTRYYVGFAKGTGLNAIKATLNGGVLYYALATPTDTEIADSDLIQQLSAILNTYQGINNLWLTPSAGAQGELSVHYATGSIDVGAGYEWEEGSDSGTNVIVNNGIDSVNPTWIVPGPATNPTLTNITTSQSITWNGSVASGETLTVDLNRQTAELGGTNVFAQLSGDWVKLAPGPNKLAYSATGATEGCHLEWNGVVG